MPIRLAEEACLPSSGGFGMGKAFAIVLMAIAVWVAVTVYSEGTDRAFGGLFASSQGSSSLDSPAHRPTPERAREAVQRAFDESQDRFDRALGETR
jgi:hypothetical protein